MATRVTLKLTKTAEATPWYFQLEGVGPGFNQLKEWCDANNVSVSADRIGTTEMHIHHDCPDATTLQDFQDELNSSTYTQVFNYYNDMGLPVDIITTAI